MSVDTTASNKFDEMREHLLQAHKLAGELLTDKDMEGNDYNDEWLESMFMILSKTRRAACSSPWTLMPL